MNDPHEPPHDPMDCPRTRLAQGPVATVDACQCGTLQVHIGALTLRVTPSALAELARTLDQAITEHARTFSPPEAVRSGLTLRRYQRGRA
jgi:hypothetical protein